jgi:hypothetical protein
MTDSFRKTDTLGKRGLVIKTKGWRDFVGTVPFYA